MWKPIPAGRVLSLGTFALAALLAVAPAAQDRLKTMPGYEQYQRMSKEIPGALKTGALGVTWQDDGKSFEYQKDGRLFRYDVGARTARDVGPAPEGAARSSARPSGGVERGRQEASATSPNGKLKAFYRDRNLWVAAEEVEGETP
ncbi:MAG: hypothetical protein EHM13_10870, partial [Acidobacteria bacterium]